MSVIRADSEDLLVGAKGFGSARAPVESMYKPDWAKFRGVNGLEKIVNRPLAFPLALGKSGNAGHFEIDPNPRHAREAFDIAYKVAGWEVVTTPAGEFKTRRIERTGNRVADIAPRVQTSAVVASHSEALSSRPRTSFRAHENDRPHLSHGLIRARGQAPG